MASDKTEEECSQELNMRMHDLIGYCEEDWNQRSLPEIQFAMDEIKKLHVIFNSNFIAMHRVKHILLFIRVAFDPTLLSRVLPCNTN